MKRLLKLTSGNNSVDFSRVVSKPGGIHRFRISMFEFTGTTSLETVHVKIDNYSQNYDETTDMYYTLFFVSQANNSITYTPAMNTEGWNNENNSLHSMTIQVYLNGSMAGDISARNCWVEIEYE